MKTSPVLALIALLPLGCAGAAPSASEPSGATSQHPTAVTVVDLTPAPAAPPAPAPAVDSDAEAIARLAEPIDLRTLAELHGGDAHVLKDGEPLPPDLFEPFPPNRLSRVTTPINDPFGAGGVAGGVVGGVPGGVPGGVAGGVGGGVGHRSVGVNVGVLNIGSDNGPVSKRGVPSIRMAPVSSYVGLPAEVIERIVRQNVSRVLFCYKKGLTTNPKLQGTVSVHFTILTDGSVARVYLGKDTTLTEISVTQCLMTAFGGFMFPQPDGVAEINVGFPLAFTPPAPPPPPPRPAAPIAPKKP